MTGVCDTSSRRPVVSYGAHQGSRVAALVVEGESPCALIQHLEHGARGAGRAGGVDGRQVQPGRFLAEQEQAPDLPAAIGQAQVGARASPCRGHEGRAPGVVIESEARSRRVRAEPRPHIAVRVLHDEFLRLDDLGGGSGLAHDADAAEPEQDDHGEDLETTIAPLELLEAAQKTCVRRCIHLGILLRRDKRTARGARPGRLSGRRVQKKIASGPGTGQGKGPMERGPDRSFLRTGRVFDRS